MKLNKFIEAFASHPSFKYYVYNKNQKYNLPISVKLELDNGFQSLKSWGVSEDRDLAFFKAFVELVERASIHSSCSLLFKKKELFSRLMSPRNISLQFGIPISILYPDNSNGAGAGTSVAMAKRSALNELIERHTILSCLLLGIPPVEVVYKLEKFSFPEQFKLSFFYWKYRGRYITVCEAKELGKGSIFAHSCDANLEISLRKTFGEIVPNLIYADANIDLPPEIKEIIPNKISSFADYWRHSGDSRMSDFLNSNKIGNTYRWKEIPVLRDIYFSQLILPKPFDVISKYLFCFRVICPQAQQLFFDNWKDEYVNLISFPSYELPEFPHFIA